MSECLLWNSGRSFFRSAIWGLSTAARVMVVCEAPPPPPPPAPGLQATAARTASVIPASLVARDLETAGARSGNRNGISARGLFIPSRLLHHHWSGGA